MSNPYEIEVFNSFKRNAKKHFEHLISAEWGKVITCLVYRVSLPEKYRDHAFNYYLQSGDFINIDNN